MNYQEAITYLFNSAPLFQHIGKGAYKEGLDTTLALDKHFHHPHRNFRSIHIAGTNGKGSCSNVIAAILQSAGYRTGLYTSPHLIDFRERIRVNGEPISEQYVTDFITQEKEYFEPLHPSFFELTTAMAFKYFSDMEVDVAIIEVGLGGRLDCTNIIQPDLCIITNISLDHTQLLGKTPTDIAKEKAGIIKKSTPVIIGEASDTIRSVFTAKAQIEKAPIIFAEDENNILSSFANKDGELIYNTIDFPELKSDLKGLYQIKNTNTLLSAIRVLKQLSYNMPEEAIRKGFAEVCKITRFMGRWQKLQSNPTVVCDAGHNVGGITYIVEQLNLQKYNKLHIVIGMVEDKDICSVLALLPKNAIYYFTKATIQRALNEQKLQELAYKENLYGKCYPDVITATSAALKNATTDDFIFIGGSSFIVADLLIGRNTLQLKQE